MTEDEAAAAIARGQLGLITLAQAVAVGLTPRRVEGRLRRGSWRRVRRGVFEINGVPTSTARPVLAACLAGGPGAVASHLTAARLWDLAVPWGTSIELLTAGDGRLRLPGVRHHRTNVLPADDVSTAAGVPVTTPARTLVDISGTVPAAALGHVVDDVRRRGLATYDDLHRCFARLDNARGGRPLVVMRAILDARAGRLAGGSRRELAVLDVLVAAGLPAPVQQHEVQIEGRSYFPDYAYPALRIALEWDGYESHGGFEAFHADRERWRRLTAEGWAIVPITSRTSDDDLVRDVRAVLAGRHLAA